ncbi:MAG: hypothetical protein ACXIUO_02915 [Erythrobacter sp.]
MSKVGYKNSTVLLSAGFVFLCMAYILLGPETSGRFALKQNDQLNFRGWIALIAGIPILVLSLPHVFHVLLRKPALEIVDDELLIWMLPYQRIKIDHIARIEVGDSSTEIYQQCGERRRINSRVLDQPRAFFFDAVRDLLANKEIIREK